MSKHDYYVDDHPEDADEISIDADLHSADWTKQSWDFPPYKSAEFMQQIGGDLEAFKKLPVYHHAIEQGLIHDDEWVADFVEPS